MPSLVDFSQAQPDPNIGERAYDYANKMYQYAARRQAGQQYAAGDIPGAARTIAGAGDFETAGKLTDRGTLLSAGEKYAAGDYAGASGILAKGGQLSAAETLATKQIENVQKQQEVMGKVGSFLEEASKDPASATAAWQLADQNFRAAGIKPEQIAQFGQQYAANPKQLAAFLKKLAKQEFVYQSEGGVTRQFDKESGNLVATYGTPTTQPGAVEVYTDQNNNLYTLNKLTGQVTPIRTPGATPTPSAAAPAPTAAPAVMPSPQSAPQAAPPAESAPVAEGVPVAGLGEYTPGKKLAADVPPSLPSGSQLFVDTVGGRNVVRNAAGETHDFNTGEPYTPQGPLAPIRSFQEARTAAQPQAAPPASPPAPAPQPGAAPAQPIRLTRVGTGAGGNAYQQAGVATDETGSIVNQRWNARAGEYEIKGADGLWHPAGPGARRQSVGAGGFLNPQQFLKLRQDFTQEQTGLQRLNTYFATVKSLDVGLARIADQISANVKTAFGSGKLTPQELNRQVANNQLQGLLGLFRTDVVGPGVMTEIDAQRILGALGGDVTALQNPEVVKVALSQIYQDKMRRVQLLKEEIDRNAPAYGTQQMPIFVPSELGGASAAGGGGPSGKSEIDSILDRYK